MDDIDDEQVEIYEPPALTELGEVAKMTRGKYSRGHSDDGDAGAYWDK